MTPTPKVKGREIKFTFLPNVTRNVGIEHPVELAAAASLIAFAELRPQVDGDYAAPSVSLGAPPALRGAPAAAAQLGAAEAPVRALLLGWEASEWEDLGHVFRD